MYVDSLQFKRAAVPVLCYPRCGGDRMKHVTAVGASLRRSIQSREDFGRLEHAPPLALVNQADNTFGKQIVEGGVGCRLRNSQAFDGLLYGQYRMTQQASRQATSGGIRPTSPEFAFPTLGQGDQILEKCDRFVRTEGG